MLHAHKFPTPEPDDEPIPEDEPEPEDDPVPHPDPIFVRCRQQHAPTPASLAA